jgi:hypothetical protein
MRMLANPGFDILRVDVHAVEQKHVVGSSTQMNTLLLVQIADVTRIEPAIFKPGIGQIRFARISAEHAVTTNSQFTSFARAEWLSFRCNSAYFDARQGLADTLTCVLIIWIGKTDGTVTINYE